MTERFEPFFCARYVLRVCADAYSGNHGVIAWPATLGEFIDTRGLPIAIPHHGHIVYVGNGATSQRYGEEFRSNGLQGMYTSNGSGAGRHLAAQLCTGDPLSWKVYDGFEHDRAKLLGFHARQRIAGKWIWCTVDEGWEEASEDMVAKRLIQVGEDITDLCSLEQHNLVLDAQWIDSDGESANCGSAMFSNSLMAHALGGYQGTAYHNTRAAFEYAVENGHTYFEVDLSYTSDRRLVASCGWTREACELNGIEYHEDFADMTYELAMSLTVYGEPVMDARDLYQIVKDHPEYTFEIDFHKVEGDAARDRVQSLLEDFRYDDDVLERLLIQIYSQQMHQDIDSIYHFTHYQYLVGMRMDRLDETVDYCLDAGICAVALRWNLATDAIVRKIKNAGLHILAYTVARDGAIADALLASGIDTVCSDHVTPGLLEKSKGRYGQYPFFVYYHSGTSNASETYSWAARSRMIRGKVRRVPSGALEFRDSRLWVNDGSETLARNRFRLRGKRFAGWHMRISIDGEHHWYCADGTFRTKEVMRARPRIKRFLLSDQQALPTVKTTKGAKLVMVAVWKPVRDTGGFLSKWRLSR